MMADMLGNQIAAGVGSVRDFIENHKAGKVHVVAYWGTRRQAAMPDVPTFDEMGLKGFEDPPYYGIYAPCRHAAEVRGGLLQRAGQGGRAAGCAKPAHHHGAHVGYMTPSNSPTARTPTPRPGRASSRTAVSLRSNLHGAGGQAKASTSGFEKRLPALMDNALAAIFIDSVCGASIRLLAACWSEHGFRAAARRAMRRWRFPRS